MLRSSRWMLCGLLLLASGCGPATPAPDTADAGTAPADAHAGHDHGEHGAHGGHLLHLEPTGAHAEWTHDDDQHLITVFLDDFDKSKVSAVKFTVKIGDNVEEFPLAAADQGWTITSQELLTHINMKEAAEVNLIVEDDAGKHSSKIEAHEHHHH